MSEVIQEIIHTETATVFLGIPNDLPEDHPDTHNCDAMGCGSCHVIAIMSKGSPKALELENKYLLSENKQLLVKIKSLKKQKETEVKS